MRDRPIVILGAGASMEYGGPLMLDFVDRAEEVLDWGETFGKYPLVNVALELRSVLRRYQSSGSINIDNIEDVLSIVDTAALSGIQLLKGIAPSTLSRVYREFIARTVEKSTNQSLVPIQFGVPDIDRDRKSLERLHTKLEHKHECRPDYITFNYDLTLEHALINQHLTPRYHHYESAYNQYSSKGSSYVAKLHGSVNWFSKDRSSHLVHPFTYLRRVSPDKSICPSRSPNSPIFTVEGEDLTRHRGDMQHWNRLIVAPSTNKVVSGSVLAKVWHLAYELLAKASHIYIIGYSWPASDAATRHLFTLGLANAKWIKSIKAVRPCDGRLADVDQHYRSLLGPSTSNKFKLFDTTLATFVRRDEI